MGPLGPVGLVGHVGPVGHVGLVSRQPEPLAGGSVVGSTAIQMDFKVPQRPNLHAGRGSGCPKHSIFSGYWSVANNQQENSSIICLTT